MLELGEQGSLFFPRGIGRKNYPQGPSGPRARGRNNKEISGEPVFFRYRRDKNNPNIENTIFRNYERPINFNYEKPTTTSSATEAPSQRKHPWYFYPCTMLMYVFTCARHAKHGCHTDLVRCVLCLCLRMLC